MVTLTLNNGTVLPVDETSNTSGIVVKGTLNEVQQALTEITTANLKNANLNGTKLLNKVYTGFNGERNGDQFKITFSMREKTEMELMREEITELQDAIMAEDEE